MKQATGRPTGRSMVRVSMMIGVAGALGCGETTGPYAGAYDFTAEVQSGNLTRTALVHIPQSYDGSRAFPLVLAFHGSSGSGANMRQFTGFDAIAEDLDFIVAYPNGAPDWDYTATSPDLDFTLDLIHHLSTQLRIAEGRVYAAGMSRGGLFALDLACQTPGAFGAVGIVAATLRVDLGEACRPPQRLPTVLAVGSLDGTTPVSGAPQFGYWSADSTIALFAGRNGCDLASPRAVTYADDRVDDGRRMRYETFSGCRDGASTALWVVEGAGHEWYRGDVDVGRELVAEFFRHHR